MTFDNATSPDTRCMRYGMAKMTMRSYVPGNITVTATSPGLQGAKLPLNVSTDVSWPPKMTPPVQVNAKPGETQ